jgi:hypothetical protein
VVRIGVARNDQLPFVSFERDRRPAVARKATPAVSIQMPAASGTAVMSTLAMLCG